jgi:hypothetical protein
MGKKPNIQTASLYFLPQQRKKDAVSVGQASSDDGVHGRYVCTPGKLPNQFQAASHIQRSVNAARRRAVYPDDSYHGEAGRLVVGDLIGHLVRQPPVNAPGVPQQQRKQGVPQQISQPSLRSKKPQQAPFEDTAPSMLLRTRHLHDPEPAVETRLDQLTNCPASAGAAQIARVLVQQAMREKHNFATSLILQLPGPTFDVCHIARRPFEGKTAGVARHQNPGFEPNKQMADCQHRIFVGPRGASPQIPIGTGKI